MTKSIIQLDVFLSSPSNLKDERNMFPDIILDANSYINKFYNINLSFKKWENCTYPAKGKYTQEVINSQMPICDIYVGLIGNKIGTPTPLAESGTIEEYINHLYAGKKIIFYFKNEITNLLNVDPDELKKIKNFQLQLSKDGVLYSTYEDLSELRRKLCFALYCHVIEYVINNKIEIHKTKKDLSNYYFDEGNYFFSLASDTSHRFVTDYINKISETRKYLKVITEGKKDTEYFLYIKKYVDVYKFINYDFELNNKIFSYFFANAMENFSKSLLSMFNLVELQLLKKAAEDLRGKYLILTDEFKGYANQLSENNVADKILGATIFKDFRVNLERSVEIFEQNRIMLTNFIDLCQKNLNK